MDLKSLRDKGGIIAAGPPIPVQVVWSHIDPATKEPVDDEFTVFVLKPTVGWLDRIAAIRATNGSRSASMISEGLRFGEDGAEKMSYEEAYRLDPMLARALLDAFDKVRETTEEAAKNSQPPTSSGTS